MKNAFRRVLMSLLLSVAALNWSAIGGINNTNFSVPFAATRVAFDPARPYAYLSDAADQALVVVNLTNGLVERQFSLDWPPESIAISPNGQRMCVALLPQPHGYYAFGPYTNYIAEFDLSAQTKTNEVQIPSDAGDLALTDNGILVVAGGSGQGTSLQTYQASDGALLGSSGGVYMLGKLALTPEQNAVYLATTELEPADIYRYDFDPVTGEFGTSWGSPYWGTYGMGGVWCTPGGTNLVTPAGTVFSSSAGQASDMIYRGALAGGGFTDVDFDTNDGAFFTVSATTLCYYNLQSLELVQTQVLPNSASYVHAEGTNLFVVSILNGQTVFQQFANPAVGAATNQAPVAGFTLSPTNPTTLTTISFDASGSTGGSALEYRWSWGEDPGQFDTAWTNTTPATHNYDVAGTKTVTLEIKDGFGATSFTSMVFNVAFHADPGSPGGTNAPFEVNVAATRVAFDPIRPYAYVTAYDQKTLSVVNLTNGFVERQFTFDWPPESIAISPNGQNMCVALLMAPHTYYSTLPCTNYIAEFDLSTQTKTNEIQIPADAGDLALTDNGILVVAGGSDQWTSLQTYQISDGALLGTLNGIYMLGKLALAPAQNAAYLATTELSPQDIYRYDFDPVTGVFGSFWGSPYWGSYEMGGVWCFPSGTNLVTPAGTVFSSSATQASDMIYRTNLSGGSVAAVAFDMPHSALLAIGYANGGSVLSHYDLSSLALLDNTALASNPDYLYAKNRDVFVAWTTATNTFFQRFQNPALPDPFITQQPASQTVVAGGEAVLSVQNRGQAPFSYQWYFDSNPLAGQTNQTLILSGVTMNQAGNYSVAIANSAATVTSAPAALTVLVSPGIIQQPVETNVFAGQTFSLSVTTVGTAPLTYQWRFENENLAGATNAILTVSDAQSTNEGVYSVSIWNAVGSVVSEPISVRVSPAGPAIVYGPASLTVPAATNVIFRAAGTGTEPISYQWFFNGVPIAGATGLQYSIPDAQAWNIGNYQVAVINSFGSVTSSAAALRVTPVIPRFLVQPAGATLPAGTNLTLTGTAIGSEPISYIWLHNNAEVAGVSQPALTFTNLNVADGGSYALVAFNILGSCTSVVAQVTVTTAPPIFVQQPASATVLAGGSIAFTSLATGNNPVHYQWFFQGTPMPAQTHPQLTLNFVSPSAAGLYFVVATNPFGAATSSVAQLTINQSPVWQPSLSNVVVDAGGTVNLAALASGSGPLSYSWRLNGSPIAGTNSCLVVSNISLSQNGYYVVVASNAYGCVSSIARVSVLGRAGSVVQWGDNSGGQGDVPAGLVDAVAVAGGDYHTLALRHNGSLVAWGDDSDGQTMAPTGALRFVALAAGTTHNLAIREDGSLAAWGGNDYGQCNIPRAAGNGVLAVAAGEGHSLALLGNGVVIAWGDNSFGQVNVPYGLSGVKAIAAGRNHSLALLTNGTVAGWGYNEYSQASPPAGLTNVTAIVAGYLHSVALLSNQTVVVWGDGSLGQTNVPAGLTNVVAIAAGDFSTSALLANGQVVAWGDDSEGQTNVPAPLKNPIAIASGNYDGLALVPGAGALLANPSASGLILNWMGTATLQWAPEANGPYTDLPVNGNCYTNSPTAAPRGFFRLRNGN
jgi:hypothetical protein